MTVKIKAPAKINLYLDVMDKRPDGYHNVRSIMQTVSLFDTVSVTASDSITVSCTNPLIPCDRQNLAYKAAEAFFEASGISGGARIHIEKNIPMAGGLAGGSTDAAAVLTALNKICEYPLSQEKLVRIGAKLGADIPFCITKGCAVCEGIGDIIRPVASSFSLPTVIANGGEGVSTPEAYKMLDEKYGESLSQDFGSIDGVLSAIEQKNVEMLQSYAYNIFEEAVLPLCPNAVKIKEKFSSLGASLTMMSGSGSSVFAFFKTENEAKAAAEKINEMGFTAVCCETLS